MASSVQDGVALPWQGASRGLGDRGLWVCRVSYLMAGL